MSKDKARESVSAALIKRHLETQEMLEGPYQKALGKLAIRFSLLHFLLERFSWQAWNLIGGSASIVTKDLPITHLAEKLKASAQHVIPRTDNRKKFLSILKNIKNVANRRNELLHSLWIIREGEPVLCISRKRGRLVGQDAPSVEQIEQLCTEVLEVIVDFDTFKGNSPLSGLGLFGFGLDLKPKPSK